MADFYTDGTVCDYTLQGTDSEYSSKETGFGCLIGGYSTVQPVVRGQIDADSIYTLQITVPDEQNNYKTVKIIEKGQVNTSVLTEDWLYRTLDGQISYHFILPPRKLPHTFNSFDYQEAPTYTGFINVIKGNQSLSKDILCRSTISNYDEPHVNMNFVPYRSDFEGNPSVNGQYYTHVVSCEYCPISTDRKSTYNPLYHLFIRKTNEHTFTALDSGYNIKTHKPTEENGSWKREWYKFIIPAHPSFAYKYKMEVSDNLSTVTTGEVYLPDAFKLMSWRAQGDGIAFGKNSEKAAFECALPTIFSKPVFFRANTKGLRNGNLTMDFYMDASSYMGNSTRFAGVPYVFELGISKDTLGEYLDETWIPEVFPEIMCPELYPVCALEDNSETGLFNDSGLICLKLYFYKKPTKKINMTYRLTKSMSKEAQQMLIGD